MYTAESQVERVAGPRGLRLPALRLVGAPLTLALAALAIYSNSFSAPFVFDGETFIVHNKSLAELWPWKFTVAQNRPVGFFTFALNYAADGLNVRGYHAVNVAIHVVAAWLLFAIVRRTLAQGPLAHRFGRAAGGLAFAVALIWLVHPLQTQSVTYVYQRLESLMAMFYLLTLYCFIRARDSARPGWWYAASIASCALGIGTKEVMVTAPLAVLWYDRVFVASTWHDVLKRRKYYLGLAACWGLLAWLMLQNLASYPASGVLVVENVTPLDYALSQPGVILHYLKLCFWPVGQSLDYNWPVPRSGEEIVPPGLAIAVLLALTAWSMYRWPACGFVAGMFFLVLSPTSSIAPVIDLAFEHRMYLPLAAVVALFVLASYALAGRVFAFARRERLRAPVLVAGLLVVAGLLGARTFSRNEDYRTDVSIWADTIAKNPANPRAWYNEACCLGRMKKITEAIRYYDRAIELNPRFSEAYFNRAGCYGILGNYEAAVRDYGQAIEFRPDDASAYAHRGRAYEDLRQLEPAIADYTKAIALEPDDASAYAHRGRAHSDLHQLEQAIADYTKAIELRPDEASGYVYRAKAYETLQQPKAAVADLTKAVDLGENSPEVLYRRASALGLLGQYPAAIEDYTKAIEQLPNYADARHQRAGMHALLGHYDQAISDYSAVVKLTPNDPRDYKNRGSAYREAGRYELALQDFEKAIELNPDFADAYLQRGKTYRLMRDSAKSIQDFDRAIQLNRDSPLAYLERGNTYLLLGQHALALRDYDAAVRCDPNSIPGYNGRAWLKATSSDDSLRDGAQAVVDATRACELSRWKDRECLDTLAAAYAENQDFAAAVKWQVAAIDLKREDEAFRRGAERRLEAYRAGKPYREDASPAESGAEREIPEG